MQGSSEHNEHNEHKTCLINQKIKLAWNQAEFRNPSPNDDDMGGISTI